MSAHVARNLLMAMGLALACCALVARFFFFGTLARTEIRTALPALLNDA